MVRRTRGDAAVPPLPRGDGWMFVELVGDDPGELALAGRCAARRRRGAWTRFVVTDPVQALALWKIREDGAGLAGVSLAGPAYPGWEDAAVPPAQLGRLPAGLRRAAGRARSARAAVRALRRRLRAHAGSTSR